MRPTRLFLAALLAGASLPAQSTLKLDKPTGSSAADFVKVVSALEIGPGRLLVADERDRKLTLIDFGTGTSKAVGRVGAGPGEFRSLGGVLPRGKGGAFLVD